MKSTLGTILAAVLLLVFTSSEGLCQGKKLELGGLAGMNIATTNEDIGQYQGTHSSISTFHAGVLFRTWIQQEFALQAWLMYNVKGGKQEYADLGLGYTGAYEERLTYISLPITAMYLKQVAEKLGVGVFAGPEFGFMVAADFEESYTYQGNTTTTESSGTEDMKTFEMGLLFGGIVQYSLSNMKIFLSYSYALGLTNIHKDEQYDSQNRVHRISVGVAFPLN